MIRIFPSLISADTLTLKQTIQMLDPHCSGFHLDVMDNHFVPNLTWGPLMINPMAQASAKPCWVHLMVTDNLSIIHRLELPAESIVSFHIESSQEAVGTIISTIHNRGWIASLAIRPNSPLSLLEPWLKQIPHILIMSVEPGFSGQRFIVRSLDHVHELQKRKISDGYTYILGMDGGINHDNIAIIANAGITDFAIASAIFQHENAINALQSLKRAINRL